MTTEAHNAGTAPAILPTYYTATYMPPGTPYPDELDVTMPVGWHVTALAPASRPDEQATAVAVLSAELLVDDPLTEERHVRRIAELLNAGEAGHEYWFARTGGKRGVEVCPPCSPDGSYGVAQSGREYACPACLVRWSPHVGGEGQVVRTRVGEWIQRVKVWATSRRGT